MRAERLSVPGRRVEGLSQEQCIEQYLPRVKQIARHVCQLMSFQSHYDDLVSTGLMGLMDAFAKFDEARFASFSTYMAIRVRGSMIDEVRNQSWVPRSVVTRSKHIELIHESFQKGLGRRATDLELSRELGVSAKDLPEYVRNASIGRVINIDDYHSFTDKDRKSFLETLDSASVSPAEHFERSHVRKLVEECTWHLKEKQREVVMLYYYEGLKNVEISQKMGISESRVCQLHREALKLLRRNKDIQLLFKCLCEVSKAA